jgi:uncharacterized protein involved in exopolysaccharide biosynthesis
MLTVKDIVQDLKVYFTNLWKKKFLVIGIAALISIGWSLKLINKPPIFVAAKTFMVSDDEGGGGGISSILGQFGIGGMGGGSYNYQKILEIGTSNLIIDQVLFETVELNGNTDFLGNHIINIYDLYDRWNKDTMLRDFVFTARNIESEKGRVARKILEAKVKGDPTNPNSDRLLRITFSEESSILKISGETKNSKLSIALAETLYTKLSRFYIDKSIERQLSTYEQLESKADSIYGLLSSSERTFATSSDFNRGLVLSQDRLAYARSMRDIEMYSAMYGEVLKNKETAEFLLNSQTPFFQAIDSPYLPLFNSNRFRTIQAIIAFIVGLIIASVLVIGATYFKKEIKPLL